MLGASVLRKLRQKCTGETACRMTNTCAVSTVHELTSYLMTFFMELGP
jgi:hypothetical protein